MDNYKTPLRREERIAGKDLKSNLLKECNTLLCNFFPGGRSIHCFQLVGRVLDTLSQLSFPVQHSYSPNLIQNVNLMHSLLN